LRLTIGGNDSMSSINAATLPDEVRRIIGMKHYSLHTENTYCDWIKQFVKFHRMSEKSGTVRG